MRGLLILALLAGPARADVLPPGHVSVSWSVVYTGLGDFPEHDFWVGPDSERGYEPAVDGEATRYYQGYGATLVATPRGVAPDPAADLARALYVPILSTAPEGKGISHSRTLVQVTGIEGDEIAFTARVLEAYVPPPEPIEGPEEGSLIQIERGLDDAAWERVAQGLSPFPEPEPPPAPRPWGAIAAAGLATLVAAGLLAIRLRSR